MSGFILLLLLSKSGFVKQKEYDCHKYHLFGKRSAGNKKKFMQAHEVIIKSCTIMISALPPKMITLLVEVSVAEL